MLLALGLVVAVSALLAATPPAPQLPIQDHTVAAGRDVYRRECASCHGEAGTGYGSASWALRQQPPDLTRYVDRTVPFPKESIRDQITGHIRLEPSHGTTEMPFWRESLTGASSVPAVTQMDALLAYLGSIQVRKFGAYQGPSAQDLAAVGKPLFATHCAGCHAADGRGPRPSQYTVGISMDLTGIAARNSGTFELRRVYESIARCDEDDWGTSAMPSWEHAFTRAGWSHDLTIKKIEALARYIQSIQR